MVVNLYFRGVCVNVFHMFLTVKTYRMCEWGVSFQSCDSSDYTIQGPAGGDDLTGLPVGPTNYQLLSELGEEAAELQQP